MTRQRRQATFVQHPIEGSGSGYRAYVMASLMLVMVFNYIDRILIAVLNEPIKAHFQVSDFAMGLLGGPAFALIYSTASLPIARLADRSKRVNIIALTLALWSGFTAACGLAAQFWQLLLARVGVGVGEAGCTPAAMSLISDYFSARARSTAIALFLLGAPVGTLIAALLGGWIAENGDWRLVFLSLGLPGLAFAMIVRLTVREPKRPSLAEDGAQTNFNVVVSALLAKPTYRHLLMGNVIGGVTMLAFVQFFNSYLIRVRELGPLEASSYFGLMAGVAAGLGTFMGGWIPDRLSGRVRGALPLTAGLGLIAATPIFAFALAAPDIGSLILLAAIGFALQGVFIPTISAMGAALAPAHMRATSIALVLFSVQFFGGVFGPPALGHLSDFLASQAYPGSRGFALSCLGAGGPECIAARQNGLSTAMSIWLFGFAWAGLHFLRAAHHFENDKVD